MELGSAANVVARATVRRVTTVFASDVGAVRREVVAEASALTSPPTIVSLHWQSAPPLDKELDQLVAAVAAAAKDLWPCWYSSVDERFDRDRWPNAEVECQLDAARKATPAVSAAWFRKAWAACQKHMAPFVSGMAAAEQLRQLSLALDPNGPWIVLLVSNAEAPPTRIHTLARAAEWVAEHAKVAVILVVPETWRGLPELDIVAYQSLIWTASEPSDDDEVSPPAVGPRVLVEPTIGIPHPASRAEQKLFDVLRQDEVLCRLFSFNQRVVAFQNQAYRVDLLCPEHRIVVEIDGHEHRSPRKYREDRDRDYHLLIAGYLTLRLTNDDVMTDIALVVEKLRNVIGLRAKRRNGDHDLPR